VRAPPPYRPAINHKTAAQNSEETIMAQSADQC
jgi:hypothetical protein